LKPLQENQLSRDDYNDDDDDNDDDEFSAPSYRQLFSNKQSTADVMYK